ncbi:penicillin-binding transpeptidase domain-containing protein, partial [Patulibacter sp. NPDC049589]|uniref:penicillin-binding transpeptidase domain-containing protein n=1 Tax=Patulibacter sp. NPDC049589 TaxID=3154731 RepID=UPI00343769D3
MSSWDDADDTEELRPLKPFRPVIPRAGHSSDRGRSRQRPTGPVRDPDGPRGPYGGGGGPREPRRPTGGPGGEPDDEGPTGFTPSRQLLLAAVGGIALVLVILLVSSCHSGDSDRDAEQGVVDRFLAAYATRSYEDMFATIDTDAQRVYPIKRFAGLNRDASRLATATSIQVGTTTRTGNEFVAPVTVETKLFGTIASEMRLRIVGSGDDARVAWSRNLTFPGLGTGEQLSRASVVPPRGTILFRDGTTPIAKGAARTSTAPEDVVKEIRGSLGPIPDTDKRRYQDLGIPSTTQVGVSGLERLLNDDLIGRPGLTLKAGDRVIGRQKAKQAKAVVSSISLPMMQAAVEAQASAPSGGGLTALDTRTGEVLAFSGDAWKDARAPGSTMKIITAAAALAENSATTDTDYPYATSALGIQNADGESCGGTLVQAFAKSCNSVFAPLAIEVGSTPFVRTAEAFGFNRDAPVPGAARSTLPDDLDDTGLALSGIGQADVRATPLEVAMMAATVATGGEQPALTFRRTDAEAKTRKVIDSGVASDLLEMMEAVITEGTGTAAQISGETVAGKTGTAEVRTTQGAACTAGGAKDRSADGASDDGAAYRGRPGELLRPASVTLAQGTTTDGGTDPDGVDDDPSLDDPATTDDTTPTEPTTTDDTTPSTPSTPTTPATPDDAPTICDPSDSTDTDAWMSAFAPATGGDRSPVAV